MILYFGMDVHSTNFTVSVFEPRIGFDGGGILYETRHLAPEIKLVDNMAKEYKKQYGLETKCIFGYEAGCLGFYVKRELEKLGYTCIVLAPSTIPTSAASRVRKNDKRDSKGIARSLAQGNYEAVHMPTLEQNSIADYIRARGDCKKRGVVMKQQISAFCLKHGKTYPGKSTWTKAHYDWLDKLEFEAPVFKEILENKMVELRSNDDRIAEYDKRIEEFALLPAYAADVGKLRCFLGIKTQQALAIICEIGDFNRFPKPDSFASFLGLVPIQNASAESDPSLPITKAGNSHLREMLVESAQGICKGVVGKKSKDLKKRQEGQDPAVIAYADKANIRLRKKYYRLIHSGKSRNKAVVAVAREYACFICGMMQGKYDGAKKGE